MAGKTKFELTGARELEAALKELAPNVAARVGGQAVRAGARPIIREAKRLVPKRTRELERSITVVVERQKSGSNQRTALIGFRPPVSRRAHLTEFGTRFAPAQPFMRPAMDSKAEEALKRMGEVVWRGIAREARRLARKR